MSRKLTIHDIQQIALTRRGKCLSKKYINWKTKLKWQCSKGHVWQALPYNVKHSTWCPICANIRRAGKYAHSIKDIQKIAAERAGVCLSDTYVNGKTVLQLQCLIGHKWETKARNILKGCWCPICASIERRFKSRTKLTIKELHDAARRRGGNCLSFVYKNAKTKIAWQCNKGHIWEADANSVRRGTWCPVCARRKIINKKKLDAYRKLENLIKSKDGRILSKEYLSAKNKIKFKCSQGHVWETVPEHVLRGTWCPYCSKRNKLTIEDMVKLAKRKGGKCLSTTYDNMKTKLLWQCSEGHIWWSIPHNIKNCNSWCPICAKSKKYTTQ